MSDTQDIIATAEMIGWLNEHVCIATGDDGLFFVKSDERLAKVADRLELLEKQLDESRKREAELDSELYATKAVNKMQADRLAELDDENGALRELHDTDVSIIAVFKRIDALRPPCPTCGGTKRLARTKASAILAGKSVPCPDCVDGKVSFVKLVEYWNDGHGN